VHNTPLVHRTIWPWRALVRVRHPSRLHDTDIATRETSLRVALRSLMVVVCFWWSATGIIFALERSPTTRLLGLVLASALAVWGAWLLYLERDHGTASGARRTFLGAAFLWTWVQVAFYGGWLVGPAALMVPVPAEAPSWGLAVRAVLAMFWYQLAMLAVLAITGILTARRANRAGWWALILFWVTHQAASINIFLGVENPGRGFFPEPLTYLESYFGPTRNSWVLPVSVALLLAFTLRTMLHALRDRSPLRRQGMMLLSVLGVLGVLELAVLGMPVSLPLWDAFLALRGY
jgi:putative photosynthetic complex assembly protein 2